jgi:biopolymer transport protein ExbD
MADIAQNSSKKPARGKVRVKRQSTKIDMTPMVDLAFLLLTFFILTTSFYKSHFLQLDMPERNENSSPINDENVLNLVLAENNKIYWWRGLTTTAEVTDYSNDGVRKLLLDNGKANPELMVLIKPRDQSRYQNMIDVLDEIVITNISRYAIVDFTEEDKMRIATQ